MNQETSSVFAKRLINEVNAGMSCLNLYLGHHLGLFQTLADTGPVTPAGLAQLTGYHERYLREWLECMAAGDYLDHDASTGRFSLAPEKAVVLLDHDSLDYTSPYLYLIPSFASILSPLTEVFRSGGGIPFETYGDDMLEAIGMGTRPMFINDYVSKWIPVMPDIQTRLQTGGRVAEIGCGAGWASISLALGFPNIQIDAFQLFSCGIIK